MSKPIRLGPRQREFLARVCKTNGGGINCWGEEERIFRSLERHGLIQGKSGQPCCAVHTREGLELHRRLSLAEEDRMRAAILRDAEECHGMLDP
jgi:hypothetical protein